MYTEHQRATFWAAVSMGTAEECWPWRKFKASGVGRVTVGGIGHVAHRIAYAMHTGRPVEGLRVVHAECCTETSCCNPAHLLLAGPIKTRKPGAPGARFASKTRRSEGCWLYCGYINNSGYGVFVVGRKQVLAHKFAWQEANSRAVPPGLVVMHKCDVRSCVRPEHLTLGTIGDNNRDMFNKNRQRGAPGGSNAMRRPGMAGSGSRNNNAKLTEAAVAEIKALWLTGKYRYEDLAAMYGCAPSNVGWIVRGANWTHVHPCQGIPSK